MGIKTKTLLVFILVVYGTNGQGLWDGPDDSVPSTNEALAVCTVEGSGASGRCVPSLLYCTTVHQGIGVTWRATTKAIPCESGVCCKESDVIDPGTNPAPGPTPGPNPVPPPGPTPDPTPTIEPTPEPPVTVAPTLLTQQQCGIQKRQTINGYVKTNDNEADPGEFPWAVFIMSPIPDQKRKRYQYSGTGALIHDRVVLTAAHLVRNKDVENLLVVAGEHNQRKKVMPKKLINVTDLVFHDNNNHSNGDFNFALIFLVSSALSNMPHVGTVCLPPVGYMPPSGTVCTFAGWGANAQRQPQDTLTKIDAPMMTHAACQQRLQQHPKLGPGFRLIQSLTCAGGEVNKNLCGGAGGSPLVCPIASQPNRFVLTGLVSWATDACGLLGDPVVFADVVQARPWIDQQMISHQYSTDSYTY